MLGGYFRFRSDEQTMSVLIRLRQALDAVLTHKIQQPSMDVLKEAGPIVEAVVELLTRAQWVTQLEDQESDTESEIESDVEGEGVDGNEVKKNNEGVLNVNMGQQDRAQQQKRGQGKRGKGARVSDQAG